MNIYWLKQAQQELNKELIRIAEEDPHLARRIAHTVQTATERLKIFPESGRPGRIVGTRELVIVSLPYILPYRVRNHAIEIIGFFHSSRNIPKSW